MVIRRAGKGCSQGTQIRGQVRGVFSVDKLEVIRGAGQWCSQDSGYTNQGLSGEQARGVLRVQKPEVINGAGQECSQRRQTGGYQFSRSGV